MLKATKAYCYEEVRNYDKILFIHSTLLKMAGGEMHTQHTPHTPGSAPGCIIRKHGLGGEGDHNSHIFSRVFFRRTNLKLIEKQERL